MFKEQLEAVIASFLSEPQGNIMALYEVLDRRLNTEPAYIRRLYVFLSRDKIGQGNQKALIYVKIPHNFNKHEGDTLDIYVHLVKIFSAQV